MGNTNNDHTYETLLMATKNKIIQTFWGDPKDAEDEEEEQAMLEEIEGIRKATTFAELADHLAEDHEFADQDLTVKILQTWFWRSGIPEVLKQALSEL